VDSKRVKLPLFERLTRRQRYTTDSTGETPTHKILLRFVNYTIEETETSACLVGTSTVFGTR